ncbi:MAG: sensor histidine kinase [bacterium]
MAKSVLVVDDEEIIRRRVGELLELDGYIVFKSRDGSEALEICRSSKPNVVLLDLKMPGISGIDVLKQIKKDFPEIEVIIITGHGGVDTAIQALREHAFSYIQKPVDYDELEIEVRRAIAQQTMRRKLAQSEKLAAVGEMAAGIMHSINNPNAFIMGNIDFLEKAWEKVVETNQTMEFPVGLAEEIPAALRAMRRGTCRIRDIVQKIKLFSRREFAPSHQEKFPLIPVIKQSVEMAEGSLEEASPIKLELPEKKEEEIIISANSGEIEEMITNLLDNAADAVEEMENGEPEIICRLSLDDEEDTVQLAVVDNGPGIPASIRDNIFDPFFTTKQTGRGTGLGLTISQGIVKRAGGELALETASGFGTKITVEFPLAQ